MIRLIQRRLIVPRGDTGTFSIPILAGKDSGDVSIFTIFSPLTHRKIFEKVMTSSEGKLTMDLTHGDTVNLPVGEYVWDIKFYTDPVFANEKLVGGTEVDSYYAAFTLPICEIRETGDNLLMADDAPNSALAPSQLNYVDAALTETRTNRHEAAASAANADISATNAETSASAALASQQAALDSQAAALASSQAAISAAESATASAAQAEETAARIEADLETKANIADLAQVAFSGDYSDLSGTPTNVSDFTNDAGYLTQHQDISGKANSADLATVATSGSYNDLSNKPFIPSAISDLTDDSGHYIKPVTGIPASDLEETYLTSFTETDPTVPAWAKAAQKPTYTAQEVGALPANTVIPTVPTNVSAFTNDAGYLTEHQDISGKANSADLATVAISGSYNDLSNKPTNISAFNNDTGYLTSFTETDPTVPSWAKTQNKPTYTASEVGAPTVAEMNSAIGTAIANVHQFELSIQQSLPTQNIDTHTIYLIPKTGDTNDVYDEYVYINNAWEMIGNTQIDLSNKADKADTVLETTLSRGRKNNTTVGGASLAFGIDTEASGYYSVALGLNTTASSQGAFAEGKNTVAHYIAHAEGEDSQALSSWSHAQNLNTIANGGASSASGRHTIANGADSFVFGRYNAADSYDNWPTWIANTSYEVGDRVKRNLMVQNEPTDVGYHCTVANSDATFDSAHWELDGYHMNYVEIVGNGKEYEDLETHQTIRAGSNAYALEWNGTAHYMGNIYVGANADSTGGSKVLCEADFATAQDIQNIINGGVGA